MDTYPSGSRKQLALQRRLDALFRALASDFLLREQFITDPAQIASEYVNGKRIPPEEAAAMNHLIYACLANNYLISWFRDYAMRSDGKAITQQGFVRDLSAAVIEQRAHHVVSALAHFALHDTARIKLDDNWLQVIFGRWHHFGEDGTDDATDATDATNATDSTGTDETGTDDATDSTGTDDATDSTGTDATDSTGTDATDSTGTDSTGTDSTGTDSTGTDLSGTLTAVTWKTYITETTEKTHPSTTPFTHTGMTRSPITTATTLNTERFLGTSHVIITLEALTSYARHLIRSGALDERP
ncbi:hypothetical protein FHW58_005086 [Duganella sp. 1224]|uniref:hypothetical protein n=1 Tax=Duganella sp. 1224 TaxID=2587052 RepID=UPI0015C79842|nr:hypothetical protein [Duganella sp. 1224]NYE63852.1 hypothetical protein [Duganella sp. 1224]